MTTLGGFEPVFCTIVPPHVLDKLARNADPVRADRARRTIQRDAAERTRRGLTTVAGAP
ncbi:peptidase M4 family protein, partial [Streptomyces olivaceus]